jgi:hypothetical protein
MNMNTNINNNNNNMNKNVSPYMYQSPSNPTNINKRNNESITADSHMNKKNILRICPVKAYFSRKLDLLS